MFLYKLLCLYQFIIAFTDRFHVLAAQEFQIIQIISNTKLRTVNAYELALKIDEMTDIRGLEYVDAILKLLQKCFRPLKYLD